MLAQTSEKNYFVCFYDYCLNISFDFENRLLFKIDEF